MNTFYYNLQVIYILWLRQIKRHFRSRARLFSSLAQPILFLIAFGFGFKSIYAAAGQGDYLQFLSPGIIAMSIVFSSMFSGIEVISDKQFGFLKETLVAPVSRLVIMFGRTLGGASVAVFQGFTVLIVTLLLGFTPCSLPMFLIALVFMMLLALLFTTIGTALASFFTDMHAFPVIINFVIMPLFFLSGALFPVEGLPKVLDVVVKVNILSYGVDGLRGSLIDSFAFSALTDFVVLAVAILIFLYLGSYLFKRMQV